MRLSRQPSTVSPVMLLRSSPVHAVRLRWLLLGLAFLVLLGIATLFALEYLEKSRAEQERAEYLERVFFFPDRRSTPPLPFLTGSRQNLVYAPGQTALAFANGFEPGEALFVRLYHRHLGLLEAYPSHADVRGQFTAARILSLDAEGQTYTPPGSLWFQVEGLSGKESEYHFRLEPGPAESQTPSQGVYPPTAIPGSVVALWCCGNDPLAAPLVDVSVDGQAMRLEALRLTIYPIAPDGLRLATLVVSLDDPTGEWRVRIDACEFRLPVLDSIG